MGSSNKLGIFSVILSLSFWALLAVSYIPGAPKIDLSFSGWVIIWILALVLAFIAAARGSGKWALAALLPVLNFFAIIILFHASEPR
jgi:hypothetical protein